MATLNVTKAAANFNGQYGTGSSGISIYTSRNVTVTCSSMQWNGKNGLEVVLDPAGTGTAVLSLKSVAANRNAPGNWDISLTPGDPLKISQISLTYGWTNCGY